MTPLQLAISHGTKIALLVVIAGLVARRRHQECRSFAVYLAVIFVCNTLGSVWPETFFVNSFWIRKQAAYDILKLVIGLELAYVALRVFPGAYAYARPLILAVLVLSTAYIADAAALGDASPRAWRRPVVMGTVWLYTALAMVVLWFRIPVSLWHRSILLGFTVYLSLFTFLAGFLARQGWGALPLFNLIEAPAYLLLMSFWGVAVWRREEAYVVSPEVAARLRLEMA